MKFVCDRCQTRYSISDEKVRQKILRIRCKTCGNVIVVQDHAVVGSGERAAPEAKPAPSGGARSAKSAPPAAVRSGGAPPPLPPRAAKGKAGDRLGGHMEWFVAIDGVRSGPLTRVEVARRIVTAGAGKEIHVWKEGMANWKAPREVSVIARELNLLQPSAPPPLPRPPTPPPATKLAAGNKPGAATGGVPASRVGEDDVTPTSAEDDEIGMPTATVVDNPFGDVTTQKMEGMSELAAASAEAGFDDYEATTKKGKSLRAVDGESSFEAGPTLIDDEATPPPVEPLTPIIPRPAASAPTASSPPVASRPAPSFTPPPALSRAPVPSLSTPALPAAPAGAPVAPVAATRAAPSFVAPALAPLAPVRAAPVSPLGLPGTPQPVGLMSGPPALPPVHPPLPTPYPVASFGTEVAPVVSLEYPSAPSAATGLLHRRPGLKYVVAALAIVGLIILLGLVILRSTREKLDTTTPVGASEPAKPEPAPREPVASAAAPSEPAKVEPAKVEPAKVEPANVAPAKAEAKAPVLAAAEPSRSPSPAAEKPSTKRGGRRAGRTQAAAADRSPREDAEPKPPRLGGARPNPFDDARGVNQGQIMAVVRNPGNQSALKSCYERALKMDNHLTSGRMEITVSIRASGTVERVVVNAPPSFILVEPCIKSVVKRWHFPSNTEDYGTNFPLIMQGGM